MNPLAKSNNQLHRRVDCTPVLLRPARFPVTKGCKHALYTNSDEYYPMDVHRVLHIHHRGMSPNTRSPLAR